MRRIKIELSEDRMGCLNIDPVNKRILRKCKRKIITNHREGCPSMHEGWQRDETIAWLNRGCCVFVQFDWLAEEIYNDLGLTKSERGDIRSGWTVIKLVDLETFDHWFLHYNEIGEEYFLS
jgi:hypothetical protein